LVVGDGQNPPSADIPEDPTPKLPDCPAARIVEIYHEVLPELPRVERLTDARRGAMRQRWREWAAEKHWQTQDEGVEEWRKFFVWVRRSAFLMGKTKSKDSNRAPWSADIDFLMAPKTHLATYEGKYHEA
jgi:hypothetical protein